MKKIQISEELFFALLNYHLIGNEEYQAEINKGLEMKLDSMVNREKYTQYKTAPTEEKRERARKDYLDRRGIKESFQW